jgi:hypothetical protein
MWCIVGTSVCKSGIGHAWDMEGGYLSLVIGVREAQWKNNLEHWLAVPERNSIWVSVICYNRGVVNILKTVTRDPVVELEAFQISGSKGKITERENVLGSWNEAHLATVAGVVVIITDSDAVTIVIVIIRYDHRHCNRPPRKGEGETKAFTVETNR